MSPEQRLKCLINAYNDRAHTFQIIGEFDKCLQDYYHVLGMYNRKESLGATCDMLLKIANIQMEGKNNYTLAKKIIVKVLADLQGSPKSVSRAAGYSALGRIAELTGLYNASIRYHKRALRTCARIHDKEQLPGINSNIGNAYSNIGDPKNALLYYYRSLRLSQKAGNIFQAAIVMLNMGNIFLNQGELDKALDHYERSFSITRKIGYNRFYPYILNNIGLIHKDLLNLDRALDHFQQALRMAESIGDRRAIAFACGNIGIIMMNNGKWSDALYYFKKTNQISRVIGERQGMLTALYNIGSAYLNMKDFRTARDYLMRAMNIAREMGAKNEIGSIYAILGKLYIEMDRLDRASAYLNAGEKLLHEVGNKIRLSELYSYSSELHARRGDNLTSRDLARKALALAIRTKAKEQEIIALRALGTVYFCMAKKCAKARAVHPSAQKYAKRSIEYLSKSVDIARMQKIKSELDKSQEELNKVLAISRRSAGEQL